MNVARCVSSMATSSRQTRASEPRATTMSLSATWRRVVDRRAVAQDPALERHPLVDREAALGDLGEDLVELAGLRLRQEADLAEVDAEDRDVDLGDRPHGAQERPVATEDDERIGRRRARGRGPPGRPTGPATGRCRAPGTSRRRGHSARRPPRSSGCRRSRCASTVTARSPSAILSPISAQSGPAPGGPGTRDCPRAR